MTAADTRAIPWTFVLDEPLRILVVDDDPILREFASVYLATPSASIDTACDGAEARLRLEQNIYDILLLDIEMPRVDGFALLAEIRANESLKHLPVIMLTGHDDIASIDRAYQLGANSFATKPVNWRQLSYHIRYVVRTSRPQGAQPASHEPVGKSDSGTTPVADHDVGEFLKSVVRRADAIERNLAAHDRERWSGPLQGVRTVANRAFAECSKREPSSATDGAPYVPAGATPQ
ncbi:MAG: two-component system, sensor histidine kinase and response regulator [Alphaproteobacteria bacterium]|jgi:DNA-binding response OmpR family regulator|nr:two-component system, sensor histidine kinase and response regulator [Alphaproteobacteria bacterium]